MPSAGPWERKKILIVVRTYPTPARKGVEVSCTAGITEDGKWIRLFPVPSRTLPDDKRFRKYQWINLQVRKAGDPRPESYSINVDTIEVLTEPITTKGNWGERKKILAPLQGHCLCCLERERDENGAPTLGFIRPRQINKLIIEQDSSTWTEEDLAKLRQDSLFELAPKHELEKLPFTFKYHFFCDHDGCSGHKLSCTDWEMGELFRKCRNDYGADWEPKFRERYEADMTEKNDTHFFVGTLHGHPNRWIIIGLFYPPKPVQKPQESLSLFDP